MISRKLIGVLAVAGFAAAASADWQPSGPVFKIVADNGQRSGEWTLDGSQLVEVRPGVWQYNAPTGMSQDIGDGLGTLTGLSLTFEADPVISLNFNAVAGAVATTFRVTSAILPVGILNPVARAQAGITITDLDGNGATVAGLYGGGLTYRSACNVLGGPVLTPGLIFADLLPGFGPTPAFGGLTMSDEFPPAPFFAPVAGFITNMQSEFWVNVSANDSIGATSVFVKQIPAPGAAGLMAVAGLVGLRRRR